MFGVLNKIFDQCQYVFMRLVVKTLYVILEANIDTFYRAKKEKKPDWLEETPEHEKEE